MEEDPAVFLKVCTRDSLAPGMLGIEGRGPQYDVLAVEGAVALASGHGGLVRVIPHGGEAIRFGIEDGDSGGLRSVIIDEDEIGSCRNMQSWIMYCLHVPFWCAIGFPVRREEGLDDIQITRKLRRQLLTGALTVRRLIMIVGLLRAKVAVASKQQVRSSISACSSWFADDIR